MKGKLTDPPLVELIREISSKGLSGTLRLEHEQAKGAIYFETGKIVFAASNLRALRLREFLTKQNLVSEKDLDVIGNDLSDAGLAAALRDRGKLTEKDVESVFTALAADVMRVALLWREGEWEFDERARLGESVRVQLDTPKLLREAAQRLPLQFASARFRNPHETVTRTPQASAIANLLPAEGFILSRLDAPTPLDQLIAMSGMVEADAHRVIYGLALSGLVTREHWQNAFRSTGKPPKEAAPTVSSDAQVKPPEKSGTPWAMAPEENDLENFLARLRKASDYYEVLDLPPKVEANEVKDAYYAIARLYHPDRFHFKSGTSLHAQISSAFARVTQAYETLTDPNARAAYDAGLERSRQFSEAAPDKVEPTKAPAEAPAPDDDTFETESHEAEYHFREGFGALQQGRINAAMTHLATASRLEPQDARFRAYYGRALAADEKTRRLAENEILAAVKLQPKNATYRTMLAELYFDLKFHRRAKTEAERALELDPNNAGAHNLMRKLDKTRKVG